MEKTAKPLTRDSLVSMQVIDAQGRLVGKVKDVAFEVGKPGMSLLVENDDGQTQTVQWANIQAASDFIVLKPATQNTSQAMAQQETLTASQPQAKKQSATPLCPTCSKPLTWIPQYSRWYCYNDKKYVNPTESTDKESWEEVFPEEKDTQAAAQKQSGKTLCPTCNQPLTWIPQYSRWYCYNEKKYV
jgi:sporulation protein YlmC with PRC-barrel domain